MTCTVLLHHHYDLSLVEYEISCIQFLVVCWCCYCLPTPMTIASGRVRYSRLWSTSQLLRPSGQPCSHSSGVCPQIQWWQCGAYVGCSWQDDLCRVCECVQRGNSGDGCDLASTLCKYDLRKGDFFLLCLARVRRVRRKSISSELQMYGGGVRSILLLPLVARMPRHNISMYMAHVCFYVCCSDWCEQSASCFVWI